MASVTGRGDSARAMPMLSRLYLRLDALIPRRSRPLYLGAALILAVSVAWFATDRIADALFPSPVPLKSIAVMPFEPLGDEEAAYLGDGLAEEIRSVLSVVAELRVIGRTSSDYFVDRDASARDIGQTLQVAYLLRGTAGREGDALNVSAQLIEASSGRRIWKHDYQGSWRQIAEFRNDIVGHVAKSLDLQPDNGVGSVQVVTTTTNDEAYALFLQAQKIRWLGRQRFSIDAVPLLQRAVELDPSYAEAHAFLAALYNSLDLLDRRPEYNPELRRELATRSMRIAMDLKPNSPFVLAKASNIALGNDDVARARSLAEAALKISANDPAALSAMNDVLFVMDDWAAAMKVTERLLTLEPLSISTMSLYMDLLSHADRYEEVREIALRALALYPEAAAAQANGWLKDRSRRKTRWRSPS